MTLSHEYSGAMMRTGSEVRRVGSAGSIVAMKTEPSICHE